jgi:hypothetical protein
MEIQEYPGYTIQEDGTITNIRTGRVLTSYVDKRSGYKMVRLWKDGKGSQQYLHRLLAVHFLKRKPQCPVVHHRDGDIVNNDLKNLYWDKPTREYGDDRNIYKRYNRYCVILRKNGKVTYVGSCDTMEEAKELRDRELNTEQE